METMMGALQMIQILRKAASVLPLLPPLAEQHWRTVHGENTIYY